jgi:hypothetical protein
MRMPTAFDLEMCRFQGEHVTRIAHRMAAGVATGRTCRDQRPRPHALIGAAAPAGLNRKS